MTDHETKRSWLAHVVTLDRCIANVHWDDAMMVQI